MDASAIVKLVVTERESEALRRYLGDGADIATAVIGRVEVLRHALRRDQASYDHADFVLNEVTLVQMNGQILHRAATLGPSTFRTLDAIHIASALALEDDLGAIVTYDSRMIASARELGLPVAAPA